MGIGLAALLTTLALYGVWSAPGLAMRWGVSAAGVALLAGWIALAGWTVARPRSVGAWAGFAGVAVALRLASLALVVGRVSPGDPYQYGELARHVLAGQGLFLDDPALGARVWAAFPPAYPLLLAGWGALFGLSAPAVLALSTLLDAGTAWLIARLGARLGQAQAGVAAGALYFIWPAVLLDAPLAQKESLELLLVLILAHGWLSAGERPAHRTAVAVGGPAAVLAMTQPGIAPLTGLFGLMLVGRPGWRRLLVVAGGAMLVAGAVLLPWWVRNWLVFGRLVPLTSVGGLSLWIGENAHATGNWMPYPASVRHASELESARQAGALATDWMRAHPGDALRLNLAKFVRAMGVGQFGLVRLDAMRPHVAPAILAALLPLSQGAQVLMLSAGAAGLWSRRQPVLTLLLAAGVTQIALFGVWFEFGERHRALLTPFLLLAGVVWVREAMGRRDRAGSTRASPSPLPARGSHIATRPASP